MGRERFLAFVRSRVAQEGDAEEILQESLLRALQSAEALRSEEKVHAWFYAILRNSITDYHRRRGLDASRLTSAFPDDIAAEEEGEEQELCLCFQPLIDTLKPEYAELIQVLDLQGGSPEVLAERLGLSKNSLKVKRHRARQALRRRLEQVCRLCAEHHCVDCTCRPEPLFPE